MSYTVVILGFYGSKRRNVEKFAKSWETVPGIKRCVLNECSGTISFLTMASWKDARMVADEIKDESTVVFHVFSNRGMFVYLQCVGLLPSSVKVAGVVFDSCPGSLSPWVFFKATAANEKNPKLKVLHEAMPYLIFLAFSYKYGFTQSLLVHIFLEFNQRMWTKLYHFYVARRDPAHCPSLFLYSTADQLVTYDLIEECANARQSAMGDVWRKRWEDSPHVRHIIDHQDEYIEQLRDFVKNIGLIN